jgi:hypothetical protein
MKDSNFEPPVLKPPVKDFPPANLAGRPNVLLGLRIALAVLVVVGFAACDVAIAPAMFVYQPQDFAAVFIYAAMGAIGAQGGLLAIWSVLGPGPAWQRRVSELTIGLFWLCAWAVGYLLARQFSTRPYGVSREVWLVLCAPAIYLAAQFPLWVVRVPFRWRIEFSQAATIDRPRATLTLAELMVVTATVAVVLGLARGSHYAAEPHSRESFWPALAIGAASAAGISLAGTLPALGLILGSRRLWVGLAILIAYALLAWLITVVAIYFVAIGGMSWRPFRPLSDALYPLTPVYAGFTLGLVVPLILARSVGYRLRWGRPSAVHQQGDPGVMPTSRDNSLH